MAAEGGQDGGGRFSNFARRWRIEYSADTLEGIASFREDPRPKPWLTATPVVPDPASSRSSYAAFSQNASGTGQGPAPQTKGVPQVLQRSKTATSSNDGSGVSQLASATEATERLRAWLLQMQGKVRKFVDARKQGRLAQRHAAEEFDPVNILSGIGIEVNIQRVFQFAQLRPLICKTFIQILSCLEEDVCGNLRVEAYSIGAVRLIENILYVLVATYTPAYRVPLQRVLRMLVYTRCVPHIARNRLEVAEFFLKRGMQKLLRDGAKTGPPPQEQEGSGKTIEEGKKLMEARCYVAGSGTELAAWDPVEVIAQWRLASESSETAGALNEFSLTLPAKKVLARKPREKPSTTTDADGGQTASKAGDEANQGDDNGAATSDEACAREERANTREINNASRDRFPAVPRGRARNEWWAKWRYHFTTLIQKVRSGNFEPPGRVSSDQKDRAAAGAEGGVHPATTGGVQSTLEAATATRAAFAEQQFARLETRVLGPDGDIIHIRPHVKYSGGAPGQGQTSSIAAGAATTGAPEGDPSSQTAAAAEPASSSGATEPASTTSVRELERIVEDPEYFLDELAEMSAMDEVKEAVMLNLFQTKVQPLVTKVWGKDDASIDLFGSIVSGFVTKSSDLDCGIRFSREVEAGLEREAFWCDWRRGLTVQIAKLRETAEETARVSSSSAAGGDALEPTSSHTAGGDAAAEQPHANPVPIATDQGQQKMFDFMSITRGNLVGLRKLAPVLEAAGFEVERVENARIPLLRCSAKLVVSQRVYRGRQGGGASGSANTERAGEPLAVEEETSLEINFDISCGHEVVFANSRLLRLYADVHPSVKKLALILKRWAKARGINDSLTGTLSSYSYVLLLVHFLQRSNILPVLQPGKNAPHAELPVAANPQQVGGRGHHHPAGGQRTGGSVPLAPPVTMDDGGAVVQYFDWLAAGWTVDQLRTAFRLREPPPLLELLEEFFFYYAYDFDFWIQVVSVRGRSLKKVDFYGIREDVRTEAEDEEQDRMWNLFRKKSWLSIEDPFEVDRILGTNAKGQERLTFELRRGYELCRNGRLAKLAVNPFLLKRVGERDFVHPIQNLISYDKDYNSPNWLGECSVHNRDNAATGAPLHKSKSEGRRPGSQQNSDGGSRDQNEKQRERPFVDEPPAESYYHKGGGARRGKGQKHDRRDAGFAQKGNGGKKRQNGGPETESFAPDARNAGSPKKFPHQGQKHGTKGGNAEQDANNNVSATSKGGNGADEHVAMYEIPGFSRCINMGDGKTYHTDEVNSRMHERAQRFVDRTEHVMDLPGAEIPQAQSVEHLLAMAEKGGRGGPNQSSFGDRNDFPPPPASHQQRVQQQPNHVNHVSPRPDYALFTSTTSGGEPKGMIQRSENKGNKDGGHQPMMKGSPPSNTMPPSYTIARPPLVSDNGAPGPPPFLTPHTRDQLHPGARDMGKGSLDFRNVPRHEMMKGGKKPDFYPGEMPLRPMMQASSSEEMGMTMNKGTGPRRPEDFPPQHLANKGNHSHINNMRMPHQQLGQPSSGKQPPPPWAQHPPPFTGMKGNETKGFGMPPPPMNRGMPSPMKMPDHMQQRDAQLQGPPQGPHQGGPHPGGPYPPGRPHSGGPHLGQHPGGLHQGGPPPMGDPGHHQRGSPPPMEQRPNSGPSWSQFQPQHQQQSQGAQLPNSGQQQHYPPQNLQYQQPGLPPPLLPAENGRPGGNGIHKGPNANLQAAPPMGAPGGPPPNGMNLVQGYGGQQMQNQKGMPHSTNYTGGPPPMSPGHPNGGSAYPRPGNSQQPGGEWRLINSSRP
ncbi:unnamed protein product [Amoebophrya sp. A25]|nr:unnamed protein product [Amoebophrya sp. A25]|eukprot:GSA25T00011749001.1